MTAPDPIPVYPSRAALVSRDDWRSSRVDELEPRSESLRDVPEAVRGALAHAWAEEGRQAHAAVATLARFALQLMSLAAPPPLLAGVAQAMQDEVAHAQACFSLARRHGGRDVGPGAIAACEPAPEADLSAVVLAAVQRGCIGDAVSALRAREALEHCEDPATREVLLVRHTAKAQQAQLAWRFLSWALRGAGRELCDRVRVACLTALSAAEPQLPLDAEDKLLLRHGVLSYSQRTQLEQRILREVVLPCMEALLARTAKLNG